MFCPKCGERISDDVNFCPYCGNNIKAFKDKEKNLNKDNLFENIFDQSNQPKVDKKKEHLDISDIFDVVSSKEPSDQKDHTIVFKNNNSRRKQYKNIEESDHFEKMFEQKVEKPKEMPFIQEERKDDEIFITEAYEREQKKKKIKDDIEFTGDQQFTVNIEKPEEDSDNRLNEMKHKSLKGLQIIGDYFQKVTGFISNLLKNQVTLIEGKRPIEVILLLLNALIIVVPIFLYTKSYNIGLDTTQMVLLYISMLVLFIVELFTALCTNYTTYKALNYFTDISLTTQKMRSFTLIISILISLFRAAVFMPSKKLIGMSSNVLTANFFGNHAIIYILVLLLNIYFVFCSVYEQDKKDLLKRFTITSISIVTITVAIYLIAATVVRTLLMYLSGVLF